MDVETRTAAARRLVTDRLMPPVKRVLALQLPDRAAGLAYYGFLSVPAVLLLVLGIVGLVYEPDDISRLLERAEGVMPEEAITLIDDSLGRVADGSSNGLTLLLVSIPLAMWSASGAMGALIRALDAVHGVEETRNAATQRLVGAGMMLWMLVALTLVVGLLVLGPTLSAWLGDAVGARGAVQFAWWIAQWPILIGGLLLAFTGVLRLGPSLPSDRPGRATLTGAIVATVLWLIISGGFSLYVNRLGSFGSAWGPLSIVVVMLVWMWLSSIALLLGAHVDAVRRPDISQSDGETRHTDGG